MNVLEQLALGAQCLARAARESGRRALWSPWLARLVLDLAVLALLAWAVHPWVSWLMAPAVRAVMGDGALRYPELYRRLPRLLGLADRGVALLVTPVVTGVAMRLFAQRWTGVRVEPGPAWREALMLSPTLVLARLPASLLLLGIDMLLGALPGVRLSGLSRALAPQVAGVLRGVVEAAFAYVPALVVLEHRGLLGALAAVPATWRRGLLPALLVCAAVALLARPFDMLLQRAGSLVDHGAPEAIAVVLAARAVAHALGGFLAAGAITLAFFSAAAPEQDEA